jgi:hypothetical protein
LLAHARSGFTVKVIAGAPSAARTTVDMDSLSYVRAGVDTNIEILTYDDYGNPTVSAASIFVTIKPSSATGPEEWLDAEVTQDGSTNSYSTTLQAELAEDSQLVVRLDNRDSGPIVDEIDFVVYNGILSLKARRAFTGGRAQCA